MNDKSLRCPQEQLLMYSENRLGKKERQRIESHVSQCERCQRELKFIEEVSHALAAHPIQSVPIGACPPASLVEDYHAEKLDSETTAMIGYHMLYCLACADKLLSLEKTKTKTRTRRIRNLARSLHLHVWNRLADFEHKLDEFVAEKQRRLEEAATAPEPVRVSVAMRGAASFGKPRVSAIVASEEGDIQKEISVDIEGEPAIDTDGNFKMAIRFPANYIGKRFIIGLRIADDFVEIREGEISASGFVSLSENVVTVPVSDRLFLPLSMIGLIIVV